MYRFSMIKAIASLSFYDEASEAEAAAATAAAAAAEAAKADPEAAAAAAAAAAANKKTAPTFTKEQQEHMNTVLAEERRKGKAKNDDLILQLETQKTRVGTTVAEKAALEDRIETLKNDYATKDELTQKESKKKQTAAEKRADLAEADAKKWQDTYKSEKIEGEIVKAANIHKAYNPLHILRILAPDTRLVDEVGEDGTTPTGRLIPKVKLSVPDKDGKLVLLEFSVTEAVKQMTEMEEHAPLFFSGASGGLGGSGSRTSKTSGNGAPPTDTDAYMKWRSEQKKKEKTAAKSN
jgi:hypothetical protein